MAWAEPPHPLNVPGVGHASERDAAVAWLADGAQRIPAFRGCEARWRYCCHTPQRQRGDRRQWFCDAGLSQPPAHVLSCSTRRPRITSIACRSRPAGAAGRRLPPRAGGLEPGSSVEGFRHTRRRFDACGPDLSKAESAG